MESRAFVIIINFAQHIHMCLYMKNVKMMVNIIAMVFSVEYYYKKWNILFQAHYFN